MTILGPSSAYKESFPLLPLSVIAQLNSQELRECENGLQELLCSLTSSSEDQTLAQYAERQRTVVQETLRHHRACERVKKLLSDEEILPTPLLLPTVVHPIRNAEEKLIRSNLSITSTVCKPFVIRSGSKGYKARQKHKKEPKAQDIDCLKQQRREASYQRLLARRALQDKKTEARQRRKRDAHSATSAPTLVVSEPLQSQKDQEPSSTESDVSNCSDSDEANEKAIIALTASASTATDQPQQSETEVCNESEKTSSPSSRVSNAAESDENAIRSNAFEEAIDTTVKNSNSFDESSKTLSEEHSTILDEKNTFEKDSKVFVERCERVEKKYDFDRCLQQIMSERRSLKLHELMTQSTSASVAISSPPQKLYEDTVRPSSIENDTISSEEKQSSSSFRAFEDALEDVEHISQENIASEAFTIEVKDKLDAQLPRKRDTNVTVSKTHPLNRPARTLSSDVKDYSQFFSSFSCIVSSIYERAVSSAALPIERQSEQVLQLQLRLYESWHSIMHDYHTVFGNPSSPENAAISSPSTAHYRVSSTRRAEVFDIVVTALSRLRDWEEHPTGLGLKTTWNLLWTWSKPNVERKTLLVWQKVNHFLNAKVLTRKDCLKKSVERFISTGGKIGKAYESLTPKTFLLPKEYVAFVKYFQVCNVGDADPSDNIWIMKPVASSRGRGISLVRDLSQVIYGEHVVIQQYIKNPLLLDGYKFDLRIYVLVTSFSPLEAFLYENGFVRLCSRVYDGDNISDKLVHLTNSSLQQSHAESGISKKPLSYLWDRLANENVNVEELKVGIKRSILQALLCGDEQIPYQINSFDLFGFDILLDTTYHPWIIEINSSPSMARDYALDFEIKDALIYDTLRLVNPLRFDRYRLVQILRRRCIEKEMHALRTSKIKDKKHLEVLNRREMNEDLTDILNGKIPRAYGEIPKHMGRYERICPQTSLYNQLMGLKKGKVRVPKTSVT